MNLLVLRFSAMGDVALTVPVIQSVLNANPKIKIWIVSKPGFAFLFDNIPGCTYVPIDFSEDFKGIKGLFNAYQKIHRLESFDAFIDLHDVMRTWVLCALGKLNGIPYYRIEKGKKDKRKLTRKTNKVRNPLKHATTRYADVFRQAGLMYNEIQLPALGIGHRRIQQVDESIGLNDPNIIKVGIAPFSKHQQKEWPIDKVNLLIKKLTQENYKVLLFGGGKTETAKLDTMAERHENIFNMAGKFSLEDEVILLSAIDVLVAMDSFNMHLATLAGSKVISIWGATHPSAGFGPIGENAKHIIQVDDSTLDCRPCSVFGNKVCWRGDHACMSSIEVDLVLNKINALIP